TLLVQISTVPRRPRETHDRPAARQAGRRAPGRVDAALLLLQRPDVVDDLPAVLVGQVLPRRHGTPAVADLPEQLAVALGRDLGRGPVRGLRRRQRGGGGTVTLAVRAVTGHAIRLDVLLGVADTLHRILRGLRLGRRLPLSLRPGGRQRRPRNDGPGGRLDDE